MPMNPKVSLEFEKPPIIEVVLGLGLNHSHFDASYFGRYYQLIKNEYFHVTNQPPIAPPNVSNAVDLISIHPRVWFETEDREKLIQLQPDRFHFNWRKQHQQSQVYPSFEKIYRDFQIEYDRYFEWLKSEGFWQDNLVNRFELTYINHLELNDLWKNVKDIGNLITVFNGMQDITKATLRSLQLNTINELNEKERKIFISIKNGQRVNDQSDILVFELTVREPIDDLKEIDDWFGQAHDHIMDHFIACTTNDAQNLWGKK